MQKSSMHMGWKPKRSPKLKKLGKKISLYKCRGKADDSLQKKMDIKVREGDPGIHLLHLLSQSPQWISS